jgi:hypothetical protein
MTLMNKSSFLIVLLLFTQIYGQKERYFNVKQKLSYKDFIIPTRWLLAEAPFWVHNLMLIFKKSRAAFGSFLGGR